MLQNLWIKDYILIDELSLDFKAGFSVFTGETGAGKSIIIDAIAILIGARVSDTLIRENADKAIIEGTFDFSKHRNQAKLVELGFESDPVIITKEIYRGGKSQTKLNHRNITIAFLRELFFDAIDVHNQKDHQYLLNDKSHLPLLDNYLKDPLLLTSYKEAYQAYHQAKIAYQKLENETFSESEIDYIKFQLQEINSIDPKENEETELETKINQYNSYEKIYQSVEASLAHFQKQEGVLERLYQIKTDLEKINFEPYIAELLKGVEGNYYELEEISRQLQQYFGQLEFDESSFNALNERLFQINRLKRKYGNSLENVLKQKQEFTEKLAIYENRQVILDEAGLNLAKLEEKALILAQELSLKRQKVALELENEIFTHLKSLELPHAIFKVVFEAKPLGNDGIDQIEFHLATNPGQSLAPLVKVASGGELSRVMLGLKAIFSNLQGIETIIFDEIDIGISGHVANAIGQKMRVLALDTQVLSITHLPQVASTAQYHYLVSKEIKDNMTLTTVNLLDQTARIAELAFMATGTTSENALTTAAELYHQNQKVWND